MSGLDGVLGLQVELEAVEVARPEDARVEAGLLHQRQHGLANLDRLQRAVRRLARLRRNTDVITSRPSVYMGVELYGPILNGEGVDDDANVLFALCSLLGKKAIKGGELAAAPFVLYLARLYIWPFDQRRRIAARVVALLELNAIRKKNDRRQQMYTCTYLRTSENG